MPRLRAHVHLAPLSAAVRRSGRAAARRLRRLPCLWAQAATILCAAALTVGGMTWLDTALEARDQVVARLHAL